jgi:hypothetical protein
MILIYSRTLHDFIPTVMAICATLDDKRISPSGLVIPAQAGIQGRWG